MERLTVRGQKGHAYFDEDGLLIRGANGAFHLKKDMTAHFIHQRFVALDKAIDRLAAYEDTGLTPEEVMELAQAKKDAMNETQSRAEKNEPLTLDELRKMDGEPVWIAFTPNADEESLAMWALVSADDEGREVFLLNNTGGSAAYEEVWTDIKAIYRHKPMEGTT